MNRSRGIVNGDFKSKELMKFINLLYDIMDVKVFYNEMGGTDGTVSDAIEELEDCILDQHTHMLKGEMPGMLKNPIFQPYMQKLLNEYKKVQLIDNNEAKVFEGEIKLQQFEEEMKDIKKKKIRGIGGMMKMGTGLDKMKIAKLFDYYSAAGDDPTDIMLLMKMNQGEAAGVATEKDSLLLLQRRQELQIELQRLRNDMHLDDEKRFMVEQFSNEMNINLSSMPVSSTKKATKKVTISDPKDESGASPTSKAVKDDKKKMSLAERRAKRLAEKKEKAAEEKEKKASSKSKDKKAKDDKKEKKEKDAKIDKDKKDDKKDKDKKDDKKDKDKKDDKKDKDKKDDKKSVDKKKDDKKDKKDDKKSVDKKKDDKKSVDKKKDDKKSVDKKKDDKKSVDKKKDDKKKSVDKKSKK